jgi:hypothetical protein
VLETVETEVVVEAGESRSAERVLDAVERIDGVEGMSHRTPNGGAGVIGVRGRGPRLQMAFRRPESEVGLSSNRRGLSDRLDEDVVGRESSVCSGTDEDSDWSMEPVIVVDAVMCSE